MQSAPLCVSSVLADDLCCFVIQLLRCSFLSADPDRAPIDTKVISQEETEISIVLTARYVRRAVIDARSVRASCLTLLTMTSYSSSCINNTCQIDWSSGHCAQLYVSREKSHPHCHSCCKQCSVIFLGTLMLQITRMHLLCSFDAKRSEH